MNIDKIVLASRNAHKIEEMKQILEPLGITVLSTQDFPQLEEVKEDQPTLEGNALKKAKYVAESTNLPALSDDTGLEVETLGGRPGVYSARYAGEYASYQDNVDKLLKELKNEPNRNAQFRTVAAFWVEGKEYTFEGVCKGEIIKKEQGKKGFGYDPVFKPRGYNKTFAELDSSVKNAISHRGKAIKKFTEFIS